MAMKTGIFRQTILHGALTLFALTLGCGKPLKSNTVTSTQNEETPLVPAGQKFAILDVQALTSTLGSSRILTARIASAKDFDGAVAFSIRRDQLDALGAGTDIVVTPVPAQVDLNPDEIKIVTVSVEVRTRSPSFTNSYFELVATEVTPAADRQELVSQVALTVQNVYEILLVGGAAPEVWSSPPSASFRPHAAGLRVRFVNMDLTMSHSITGTGAVPSQTGTMAQATAAGPGGNYEFTVLPADGAVSGTYHCGNHENMAQDHTLMFNQP